MLSCPKVETPPAEPESGLAQTSGAAEAQVPVWTKPTLLAYGDVRQLTMGVTTRLARAEPPPLITPSAPEPWASARRRTLAATPRVV